MKKVDLNALKQLSNIELFLLLCGTMTISFAVHPAMVRAEKPLPPQKCDDSSQRLPDSLPNLDDQS